MRRRKDGLYAMKETFLKRAFIHLDCQLLWTIYIVIMGKESTMKRNSVVVKISHLPQ